MSTPNKILMKIASRLAFSKQKRKELRAKYEQACKSSMKLGVAYNLFDGEELLEASILSIREAVDYVAVVYQTVSNYGNRADIDLLSFLEDLKTKKLVDDIYEYTPDLNKSGAQNETTKRNIGLQMARKKGCTHFLCMDTDEFYKMDEFKTAKDHILKKDLDCTAASFFAYVKEPTYRLIQQAPGNVPFIHKIHWNTKLGAKAHFPVITDPTRIVSPCGKFWLFPNVHLMMHHMAGVRKDIHKKYKNSSFNDVPSTQYQQRLNRIKEIENYELGKLYEGSPVFEVENIFNIHIKD